MISMCVVYMAVCFFGMFFCHLSCLFFVALFADFFGPAFWLAFLSMQYKSLLHVAFFLGGGV